MKIIGIDASTKCTGVSLIDSSGHIISHDTINLRHIKDIDNRTDEMMREIALFFDKWKPNICYIEDTWSGTAVRNIETTKKLTSIQGAIRYMCILTHCSFHKITPSSWRSIIGISGGKNTKREEFKARAIYYIKTTYGIEVKEDEAEACCIAVAAYMHENGDLFE